MDYLSACGNSVYLITNAHEGLPTSNCALSYIGGNLNHGLPSSVGACGILRTLADLLPPGADMKLYQNQSAHVSCAASGISRQSNCPNSNLRIFEIWLDCHVVENYGNDA